MKSQTAFEWARYNDATVNAMLCGDSPLTAIIAVMAREKSELMEQIARLEMIVPKKITMPDGSIRVYHAPTYIDCQTHEIRTKP